RDYPLFMARTIALVDSLGVRNAMASQTLQLMGLAANLSSAQTSADVRAAFEGAAAPVGLWQEKRYGQGGRTTITAFPGFAGGFEDVIGSGRDGWTAGAAAQIGFEYQLGRRVSLDGADRGCGWVIKLFCSVGIFIPVVDLGTLVTYRLDNDAGVDETPNDSFRQVIAPGVFLSLGIRHSPLALLVGAQFIPTIREVASTDDTDDANAWRLGAALALDVPLFRF
ncbi:MAG TPA: hypothetical protein VFT45_02725, partial [Longimicrobium sp.]|nr:hypothetical protein [Longimicrobium sp.]